ncbi:MAG TPA: dihydroorotate dehydrogenase [Elusimicrobiota bacterium]|nr:dihydroorotate dehydrogenase [Elusimicrobiota bacterium]
MPIDLSIQLGPLALKNPVLVAAGTFGYGIEFQEFFDLRQLGALITKTITLQPRLGNPAPRLVETPAGMLNAVGLQNIGVEEFFSAKWPALRALGAPVILSIAGFTLEEFGALASRAAGTGIAALELNLSCPNVAHAAPGSKSGQRCFAQSAEETASAVRTVKGAADVPVFAKLSAEVSDLAAVARAAVEAGADGLTLINTIAGMVIDSDREAPALANRTGGLSGPAIRPIAVRCVWEARQAVRVPIIGVGGVASGRDALEMILAGASAIQVGTANFWNPRAPLVILKELGALVGQKKRPLRELIGAVRAAPA